MSEWRSRSAIFTPSKPARDLHQMDTHVERPIVQIGNLTFLTQAKIFVLWCGHASKKKRTDLCDKSR
jgi:hypothetical protein